MNTLKKIAMAALVASATLASTGLLAQPAMDISGMKDKGMAMDMKDMKDMDMSSGEVRKIDKDAQKITLKHGEIKSMDMPGMTMVFKVLDPTLLDKVKVGDKVRFNAEKRDGAIVVTEIEAVK
jgi:Cu(I)/Ag(I) efflux system protein CusF